MNRISYVYLETYNNDPEEVPTMVPCLKSEEDLLAFELTEGFGNEYEYEEMFGEGFRDLKSGFYKVEYSWHKDNECYDTGHVAYEYDVVDCIEGIEPSVKAALLYFWNKQFKPTVSILGSFFKPHWYVDVDYGGMGTSRMDLFLPQAIWVKLALILGIEKPDWKMPIKEIKIRSWWC